MSDTPVEKAPTEILFEKLLCNALDKPWSESVSLDSLSHDIMILRAAMQLIVRGQCGACKRMNPPNRCTISDGQGGEGCGEGKLCYHDSVDAEQVAEFALETIGVK